MMHRKQTGILFFWDKSTIVWYIKQQNTGKAIAFGSELRAMKDADRVVTV